MNVQREALILDPTQPKPYAFVTAMRLHGWPAMIALMDARAGGRRVSGMTLQDALPDVLHWAKHHLDPFYAQDALWLHIGPDKRVCYIHIGEGYRPTMTTVRWPGCAEGSLRAMFAAHKEYSAVLMEDLEEITECL